LRSRQMLSGRFSSFEKVVVIAVVPDARSGQPD
jgi:hypothetical protein